MTSSRSRAGGSTGSTRVADMAVRELGPASLAVAQACARALADDAGPVVVAVSGGADSLALAAGVAWAARRLPLSPTAVVVDHQLQAGSADIAARAAAACESLGLPAVIERIAVPTTPAGPEADARDARYAALLRHQGPVLLGHTRDDQAETVLLGLARGSGTRSLAGMAPRVDRLVRPLLGLGRDATATACTELGLDPWADPHNDDSRFARVRARRVVLPVLEAELGPGVTAALARTAELAREDADALDALAAEVPASEALDVDALAAMVPAVRSRVIRRWLLARGTSEPTSAHVAAVRGLVEAWRGQGPLDLPGARVVRRGRTISAEPPSLGPSAL